MRLRDFLYPAKCVFCGSLYVDDGGICEDCLSKLPYVTEPVCVRCGKPISDTRDSYCADCEGRRISSFDRGTAVWIYTDMTRRAMVDFKYGGCMTDAHTYALEMVRRCGDFFRTYRPQAIVPVPVHTRRLRFRGYNQAQTLSSELGSMLGIPEYGLIIRSAYTKPLKSLTPEERRKSLSDAFELDVDLYESVRDIDRVLLVDDIYTTGSTIEVCAQILKDAGIDEVYAAYLCIGKDY